MCQIDHTPTDINFVEVVDGVGLFVGRPYLTVVTDVATRSILGFCLTLEKPSVLSVALCLAQAMCPKEAWLAARDLNHAWPMFGGPRLLVTDSAMEFKGYAFQRGCDDYGIRIRYRDAVSDRWPVTVTPQPEELLSSWLHRLAYANGVATKALARVLGLSP